MAKRQPDRFTQLSHSTVQQLMGDEALDLTAASGEMVRGAERIVQQLLLHQHRAVVRRVKRLIDERRAEIRCIDDGLCDRDLNRPIRYGHVPAEVHAIQREIQVCDELLAALAAYREGGR